MNDLYGVILADPPWQYRQGGRGAVKGPYPTMPTADLAALDVAGLAAPDCALLLWATWPNLPDALALGAAWKFTYKTAAFLWVKLNRGMVGKFADLSDPTVWFMGGGLVGTRANTEPCLLFTRGHVQRQSAGVRQLIVAPASHHLAKPTEVYSRVEALYIGPYLELFAQQRRAGWDAIGSSLDGRDIREVIGATRE